LTKAPFVQGWNDEKKTAVIWRPPCGQWGCPVCGEINRRRAAARAYLGTVDILKSGSTVFFLTLTSHENLTPEATWRVLPNAWNKLRLRAMRKQPGALYFMVPEHHKDARAHVHAITTLDMNNHWWHDNARQCGLGYEAENQVAKSPLGAGSYVLKYLVKQMADRMWKKGKRRYNASQAWPKLPDPEAALGWQFAMVPRDMSRVVAAGIWKDAGFEVRFLEDGQRIADLDRIAKQIISYTEDLKDGSPNAG
jgi:hypothetical protein